MTLVLLEGSSQNRIESKSVLPLDLEAILGYKYLLVWLKINIHSFSYHVSGITLKSSFVLYYLIFIKILVEISYLGQNRATVTRFILPP